MFHYRIRTLLVLSVICAVTFGALRFQMHRVEEDRARVAALEDAHCFVNYCIEVPVGQNEFLIDPQDKPPGPKWARDILGDHFFCDQIELYLPRNFGQPYPRTPMMVYACGPDGCESYEVPPKPEDLRPTYTEADIANATQLWGLTFVDAEENVHPDFIRRLEEALPHCWFSYPDKPVATKTTAE